MSARICTPPTSTGMAMMDLSRDLTPTGQASQPVSSSSYPGTSSHTSALLFGGLAGSQSSGSADSVNRLCRSVSRNLFGAPDRSCSQYARQKVQEMLYLDSKKWNFDFAKEKPLDGRYKWEAITTEIASSCGIDEGASSGLAKSDATTGSCASVPPGTLLRVRPVESSTVLKTAIDTTTTQETLVSTSLRSSVSPSSTESLSSDPVPEEPISPVLVESSVESSEDDAIVPSLLKTDSSSIRIKLKSKQTKLTDSLKVVKKRRGEPEVTTAGKKKASL